MMTATDWEWIRVSERMPADQQPVALKLKDDEKPIRYGIGWYSAQKKHWVITAKPDPPQENLEPFEWIALP